MFTKKIEDMNMSELVNYITKNFHEPLRKDIKKLELPVVELVEKYKKDYPEISILQELFSQFRKELLKHITKEDFIVFPTIIKYERINNDELINLSDNLEIMEGLVNNVQMKNEHGDFNSYLDSIIQLMNGTKLNTGNNKDFESIKSIFIKIQVDNVVHSNLENSDLYYKGMLLQNKLKERLKNV